MNRTGYLLGLAAFGLVFSSGCSSNEPAPEAPPAAETSPVERGQYLVNAVAMCFYCHSEHDWSGEEPTILAGGQGAGSLFPDEGIPGRLYAPNITPDNETGIGLATDEQLDKAIREGIGLDGRRLFPAMPNFSMMSDEDLAAIVAYLRSQPAVSKKVPARELPEPVVAGLPPAWPVSRPVRGPAGDGPSVERGQYLASLADCGSCHTAMNEMGQPRMEMAFGGGFHLKGPWGDVVSSNITFDPSGIEYYDEALFKKVLTTGDPGARRLNKLMPVHIYRNMTDRDMTSVFLFLQSLPHVKHRVDNTEDPMPCKICGANHGLGADN
jgi:mono/diheme cytochrome c family protein